jgi:archaeal cell division control protein 6
LTAQNSVFKDETKLDLNYIPSKLVHRDSQLRLLNEYFSFLWRYPDKMAQRVIITGDVGTGKTVLAQRFGADITSQANKRGLKMRYIHINCREVRGLFSMVMHHAITVFRPQFPSRGYSAEEILNSFLQVLEEDNVYAVVALDEFDSLIKAEGSEAVYKLTRLQEMRSGKPQRVSFVFVLRDLSSIEQLDDSAKSTLQSNIIRLERYGKDHLIDLLGERVSLAFERGAVMEDSVSLIAELAAGETGNARFGIELLLRAGKYADAEDSEIVLPEYVRKAVSSIIPTFKRGDLDSLGLHEKLLLLGIARLFKNSQKGYASIAEVEQAYAVACEEYAKQPKTYSQIWRYIQYLTQIGVLKTDLAPADRGQVTRVFLPSIPTVELEKQLSVLLENEEV